MNSDHESIRLRLYNPDGSPAMTRRRPDRQRTPRERVEVHPNADREKIAALRADMVQAFMQGDLRTYALLENELRWMVTQEKQQAP